MSSLGFSLLYLPLQMLSETSIKSSSWLGDVNIFKAIRDCDPLGKVCLVVLAIFSIMSWAIIIFKLIHIRLSNTQTKKFIDLCAGTGTLEDAFRCASSYPDSPLAQIAKETYMEVQMEDWYRAAAVEGVSHRLEVAKLSIERVHERVIMRETAKLESWLILLATTSSVGPYIGLLGTVWGILGVFQNLASQSSATLSVIAPGISTALTATVGGLLAAIPAVVMYNYFTNSIQAITGRMDSFALELTSVTQKQVLEDAPVYEP